MDFSQSPRLADPEESAVDLTRKIAVHEDECETDDVSGDLADHLITPSIPATGVAVDTRRRSGSRGRSTGVRPQGSQRQRGGRGGRHTRTAGAAARLRGGRGPHRGRRAHRTACPVSASAVPRWSPVPALRDAMEPCHAVQHCASRCREMFRDIAPMGTWRGDFGEHAAPPDGVPAFGVTVAVHDRDPGPVARAVPARCGVASPEDVPPARPAGVGTALPALPTAAAPLQPVGAHIVHESGLPLPEASQTTGS